MFSKYQRHQRPGGFPVQLTLVKTRFFLSENNIFKSVWCFFLLQQLGDSSTGDVKTAKDSVCWQTMTTMMKMRTLFTASSKKWPLTVQLKPTTVSISVRSPRWNHFWRNADINNNNNDNNRFEYFFSKPTNWSLNFIVLIIWLRFVLLIILYVRWCTCRK